MNEAMDAEFDTVAAWTAQVAADLGAQYHLPAGCRGSGSPVVLDWLVGALEITGADRMLDCGAGVGGPAAFAMDRVGVRPVLTDPEPGACRSARKLFGLPAVQAASDLPFRSGSFDVAWCLGVLCTVEDHGLLLAELRRVLGKEGRLGLLVYTAAESLSVQPEGNNFPALEALPELLARAGLRIASQFLLSEFDPTPPDWQARSDEVDAELERRYTGDPRWRVAVEQSVLFGELLARGELQGTALIAAPA
jgi:SAM-dependent methyltransferase